MLVTALATAERRQEGEEHDDGDDLLSSIPVSLRHLAHKFYGVHLFANHEGSLMPAKQLKRWLRWTAHEA